MNVQFRLLKAPRSYESWHQSQDFAPHRYEVLLHKELEEVVKYLNINLSDAIIFAVGCKHDLNYMLPAVTIPFGGGVFHLFDDTNRWLCTADLESEIPFDNFTCEEITPEIKRGNIDMPAQFLHPKYRLGLRRFSFMTSSADLDAVLMTICTASALARSA